MSRLSHLHAMFQRQYLGLDEPHSFTYDYIRTLSKAAFSFPALVMCNEDKASSLLESAAFSEAVASFSLVRSAEAVE